MPWTSDRGTLSAGACALALQGVCATKLRRQIAEKEHAKERFQCLAPASNRSENAAMRERFLPKSYFPTKERER